MDHEFGSSFLEPAQIGWDWFSIQLDEGTDLMVFQLRRRDWEVDGHSSGTLVFADGTTRALGAGDFSLRPGATWQSPDSGAKYPVVWKIDIPAERLSLDVRAAGETWARMSEHLPLVAEFEWP